MEQREEGRSNQTVLPKNEGAESGAERTESQVL